MTKAKSTTRHLAIVLGLALLISPLQGLPAQGVESTVNCSTSGTITITDGVEVSRNDSCTGAVVIPNGITRIYDLAFDGATALTSVSFPQTLTLIGMQAFRGTTALESITIPNSVVEIQSSAFQFSGLTLITIPSSVVTLGSKVFSGSASLTDIFVDSANPNFATIDGVLTNKAGSTLIHYPAGNLRTTYAVPDGVLSIGDSAFFGASRLTEVSFSNQSALTSIGSNAFQDATGLTSINIPATLSSLGTSAFWNATSLTALTIPAGVTSIGSNAFKSATSLASITFGPGSQLTSIGSAAFNGATSLASIALPSGVTAINAFAFSGASNLASVFFAGNAPTPGSSAFSGVHPGALAQITSVATGFGSDGSTWNRLTVDLVKVTCLGGGSLTVTKKVVSANSSCVGSVDLPATITGVNDGSIAGAAGIASISVAANNPNFVAENGVLFNADKTTLVAYPAASANVTYAVPAEVTTIAASAFAGASNLASLTFAGDAPTVGSNTFTGLAAGATANITSSAVGFGDASLWNSLTLIRPSVPVVQEPTEDAPVVVTEVPASAPIYVVTPPAVVATPPALVVPHALESVAPIFPRFSVQLAKSSKLLIGVDSRRSSATIARNSQGFIMNATISRASRPFCTITKARKKIGGVVRVSGFKVTAKNAKTGICQVTLYAAASPTHKASQKTFAVRVSG